MRKICKKIAIILSLLLMLYSPIQVFGLSKDKDIAREAHYAIAFDTESREILYEKKAFDNVPMASTTKILTAILAINYGSVRLATNGAKCSAGSACFKAVISCAVIKLEKK